MKRMTICMLIASLSLGALGWARDIRTTTGEIYHNAVVTRIQPAGIRINHDDGTGFIDYQLLSEQDRQEFGFDPATYAAAQRDQAELEKQRQAMLLRVAEHSIDAAARAADATPGVTARNSPSTPFTTEAPVGSGAQQSTSTVMDVGVQTPNFSYQTYGASGWTGWPVVAPGFVGPGFGTRIARGLPGSIPSSSRTPVTLPSQTTFGSPSQAAVIGTSAGPTRASFAAPFPARR